MKTIPLSEVKARRSSLLDEVEERVTIGPRATIYAETWRRVRRAR